jgi:hypothetical protein
MDGFFMRAPLLRSPGAQRLFLLGLNVVLAVMLGFFAFTADQSMRLVIYGGYWAMLGLTGLFIWAAWRALRPAWPGWPTLRAAPRWPAALVTAGGIMLLVQESYGFKILMDEAMLLGTSLSMHFDKTALVPMRGNDIQGAFQFLSGQLDKRPLFQPFLVSTLHDVTGYRPENVFILNSVLVFVLLALAYHLGRRLAGRSAGALAVLLLTGLPLLAQNATGGGFELLNLVMILGTLALALRFMETRDVSAQDALLLAAVLLAHTRYESVLFLVPVVLLIGWVWRQERRVILSPLMLAAPLLLLPYALHHQVFSARASAWELAGQPGSETPFSVGYAPDNLAHALNFLFNTGGEQPNSLVLSCLGVPALAFFVLLAAKTLRQARTAGAPVLTLALFGVGFAAHTVLMMCYFWGKFDDPVIRRLSLPLNLWLVLAVVAVTAEFARDHLWPWRALLLAAGGGLFAYSLPSMARHEYTLEYYIGRETEWRRQFVAANPERDYLVIDNSSIIWLTHLVSATPMLQANLHKENLVFHFRNHTFRQVYVFQRFEVDPDSGRLTVQSDDDLSPDYELETVTERRFTPLRVSRISRVVSIREGPTVPPRAAPTPLEKLTPAQLEKIRVEYFEQFIKRLP